MRLQQKIKPERSLITANHRARGRNNQGLITIRHRGGGHKRRYRVIDFKRNKHNIAARVASIEYDPNRNARISLLHYQDGEKRYILTAQNIKVGTTLMSGPDAEIQIGNSLPLENIPLGLEVHNVELIPNNGGQSQDRINKILAKEGKYVTSVNLLNSLHCWATTSYISPITTLQLVLRKL